jgi:hypothetical protein
MNATVIRCPRCHVPGVLYSERSIEALIGSRHIAHVLHARTGDSRRMCLLARSKYERISQTTPQNRRMFQ